MAEMSRGEKKARLKLGYVAGGATANPGSLGSSAGKKVKTCRSKEIEKYLKYYDDTAYDHLRDWFQAAKQNDPYVPIRDRKPYMRLNLSKMMCTKVAAKLAGAEVFPNVDMPEAPEEEYYFKLILRISMLQATIVSASKSICATGSGFVRFYIAGGKFRVEHYNSNYCYPEFDESETLISCRVQYVYTDHMDLDQKGMPKKKWYRADFGTDSDVLYDNPEFSEEREPLFEVKEEIEHSMDFVQGEWFTTGKNPNSYDGPSLLEDIAPMLDSINYSMSLAQESTDYNTAPQLAFKGMDEEEIEALVRSNQKAWNVGRDGEGHFLESSMKGVEMNMALRDKTRQFIQDLTRVVLLDPEKIVGSAQSGKAMEVLHGPLVELIGELRPQFEIHIKQLVIKMGIANLIALQMTGASPVSVPPGWVPQNLDIQLSWPPVFPLTVFDKQQLVTMVAAAVSNNLISRRTGIKELAPYFGVEDVDAEYKEIIDQPPMASPFGMF